MKVIRGQLSTSKKDYISTIYSLTRSTSSSCEEIPIIRIKDISSSLGVAPPSVVEYVQRLKNDGYLQIFPRKGVRLTDQGMKEANVLKNRFKIVQCFLQNVLHIDAELATKQAYSIEHLLNQEVISNLYTHIQNCIQCPNKSCTVEELCTPL